MKSDDKRLVMEKRLPDVGVRNVPCHRCGGRYVFQRVINAADVPYSVIVCADCAFEVYSLVTEREKKLLDYANEMFAAEANQARWVANQR